MENTKNQGQRDQKKQGGMDSTRKQSDDRKTGTSKRASDDSLSDSRSSRNSDSR